MSFNMPAQGFMAYECLDDLEKEFEIRIFIS